MICNTLTAQETLQILQKHGHESFDKQTGLINGQWCSHGTSFAEQVGIKDTYTVKEVKEWLGY